MILVCGEALIDLFVQGDDPGAIATQAKLGGSPFNTAIALSRLGAAVAFCGGVSRDSFGDLIIAKLLAEGVDASHVIRLNALTTISVVATDARGNASYSFHGEGKADRMLAPSDIALALPDDIEAIAFGSYTLAVPPVAEAFLALAEREGRKRTISLDPNVRPTVIGDMAAWRRRFEAFLPHAGIVKASDEDIAIGYAGDAPAAVIRRWQEAGAALVLVTHGARGATGYLKGHPPLAIAGRDVAVRDTIGAGDTFHAGILAGLSRSDCLARENFSRLNPAILSRVMAEAVAASALTCTREGADPPDLENVTAFLSAGPA